LEATILKYLAIIISIILVVIFYIGLLSFVVMVPEEIGRRRRLKNVGELISNVFLKRPLTRKQIQILSTNYRLTSRDVQILLCNQFAEAIKSVNDDQDAKVNYFQELYEKFEKDEPFEGLPSDLRIHLERIREALGEEKDLLMQALASQLQNLNSKNRRKDRWMWMLAITSVVLGLIGVIFGVLPYIPSHDKEKIIMEKKSTSGNEAQAINPQ
jgi:hypothetical protein